jgi:hypothetical protein
MHPRQPNSDVDTIGVKMTTLQRVLKHRSTSVAADEPLCMATLIGISIDEVLVAGDHVEIRMAKVWDLIAKKYGKIPQAILGLPYPRLTVKGFQWAPKTLLREISNETPDTKPARWMSQTFGMLSKEDFELTAPGFTVSGRFWDGSNANAHGDTNLVGLVPIQDQSSAWFSIGAREHIASFDKASRSETLSLPPGFPSQGQWAVLLVNEKYLPASENLSVSEGMLGQADVSSNGKIIHELNDTSDSFPASCSDDLL